MGVKKGGRGRLIRRTKGGMNTKLHAICDSQSRAINLFVFAGQVSDYIGARASQDLLDALVQSIWGGTSEILLDLIGRSMARGL